MFPMLVGNMGGVPSIITGDMFVPSRAATAQTLGRAVQIPRGLLASSTVEAFHFQFPDLTFTRTLVVEGCRSPFCGRRHEFSTPCPGVVGASAGGALPSLQTFLLSPTMGISSICFLSRYLGTILFRPGCFSGSNFPDISFQIYLKT